MCPKFDCSLQITQPEIQTSIHPLGMLKNFQALTMVSWSQPLVPVPAEWKSIWPETVKAMRRQTGNGEVGELPVAIRPRDVG